MERKTNIKIINICEHLRQYCLVAKFYGNGGNSFNLKFQALKLNVCEVTDYLYGIFPFLAPSEGQGETSHIRPASFGSLFSVKIPAPR